MAGAAPGTWLLVSSLFILLRPTVEEYMDRKTCGEYHLLYILHFCETTMTFDDWRPSPINYVFTLLYSLSHSLIPSFLLALPTKVDDKKPYGIIESNGLKSCMSPLIISITTSKEQNCLITLQIVINY